ncbi:MAG: hypothetical protein Q4G11_07205, partial [Gallicola sp.]|nr:hypothetical protein [Gallicola sp.]
YYQKVIILSCKFSRSVHLVYYCARPMSRSLGSSWYEWTNNAPATGKPDTLATAVTAKINDVVLFCLTKGRLVV